MLKNIVKIEFLINDKIYQFLCDNDAPLEHVKEALFQCQKYIGQIEDNLKSKVAAVAAEPSPDEPVAVQEQTNTEPPQEV